MAELLTRLDEDYLDIIQESIEETGGKLDGNDVSIREEFFSPRYLKGVPAEYSVSIENRQLTVHVKPVGPRGVGTVDQQRCVSAEGGSLPTVQEISGIRRSTGKRADGPGKGETRCGCHETDNPSARDNVLVTR